VICKLHIQLRFRRACCNHNLFQMQFGVISLCISYYRSSTISWFFHHLCGS